MKSFDKENQKPKCYCIVILICYTIGIVIGTLFGSQLISIFN